ncbi:cytochrome P450 [Diaporthe helianthi]|uniref:Cytochrome P450 n=1 Tax=Diaporthe helianthi TaxID=158607 RepID=A0A2P5HGQ6_DIAHE|nr:cytochrome P450 [Diaporthe helianthi]
MYLKIGPNEITIFHPDGLAAINKIGDVERGSWYDLVSPAFSVNTVRNQAMHDRRRKVWEAAFTPEAMKDYEHRIRRHAGNVETSLRKAKTTIIDMNSIIYRFGYSVMSDLAFGKEADEMDTEWQRAFRTMHMGLSLLGPLSPAPWIALLFFSFTWIPWVRDWNAMMKYCSSKMQERVAMSPPPKSRDISSWLIEDAQRRQQLGTLEEQRWLDGDGFSVILAGSDTTASTLIFAFNYLAKRPEYQHRIRDELARALRERGVDDAKEDPDLKSLNFRDFERLSFLNAFIDELLRLHHPLPTAGARVVQNPAGLDIGGQHIPRGTNVVAPRWCDGRCETHYERAREFIPERWLNRSTQSEPDEKKLYSNRRAFTPWAGGRWSCLGKPLALFEMRYLISLLVSNFNITFPAGESGDTVEWGYKDQVTAFPGQVNLEFQPSK